MRERVANYGSWLRETFGGVLAPVVKYTTGAKLVDRFGDYSRDLKAYYERKEAGANTKDLPI
jgi:hypothetical protein